MVKLLQKVLHIISIDKDFQSYELEKIVVESIWSVKY